MKNSKAWERVKGLFSDFKERSKLKKTQDTITLGTASSFSYGILGKRISRILPLFKDLDSNLERSGLKVNFKAYVSLTLLTSILLSSAALLSIPSLLTSVLHVPFPSAVLFGVGGSLFVSAFSVVGFYIYPIYRADKLRREIEDELPFTTGYMAILANAGVSYEKIFLSLSSLNVPLAVSNEAKNIVRDLNLFGLDIISALERASKRTSSVRFRQMVEGFISTIHSGGDLAAYLRGRSREYMKLKRISLSKFSDNLSILSEFYVALLVTGPLLLVVMLAVIAMLGGTLGILDPTVLLSMLTYLGIPLSSIMFLIVLDAISPKW